MIFKKIYENFVATLETVRNREVTVLGGSTVLYFALLSAVFKVLFAVLCKPQQTRQGESSTVFMLKYRHEACLSQKGK